MSGFPSLDWMAAFQERVNRDEELALIGRRFTTSFLFGAGDTEYTLRVEAGRLVEIVAGPGFDRPWSFAMRAPVGHWEKFIQPLPPPLFNEIFAMVMRVPEFHLVKEIGPFPMAENPERCRAYLLPVLDRLARG